MGRPGEHLSQGEGPPAPSLALVGTLSPGGTPADPLDLLFEGERIEVLCVDAVWRPAIFLGWADAEHDAATFRPLWRTVGPVDTVWEGGRCNLRIGPALAQPDDPVERAYARLQTQLADLERTEAEESRARRQEVLAEVQAWIRLSRDVWEAAYRDPNLSPRVVTECERLHETLVIQLFARIGGAL